MNHLHFAIIMQFYGEFAYGLDGTLYYVPDRIRDILTESGLPVQLPYYAIVSNEQVKVTIPAESALGNGTDEPYVVTDAHVIVNWFDKKDELIKFVVEQKELELQAQSFALTPAMVDALNKASL